MIDQKKENAQLSCFCYCQAQPSSPVKSTQVWLKFAVRPTHPPYPGQVSWTDLEKAAKLSILYILTEDGLRRVEVGELRMDKGDLR